MNFKIISLVTGLVLTATLASCTSNAPTSTEAAPSSPAVSAAPSDANEGRCKGRCDEGRRDVS